MPNTKTGTVRGPAGNTGAQGDPGPVGDTGAQGVQGANGSQGPAGPTAVSTDVNNTARLGSDSRLYVPQSSAPLADMTQAGLVRKLSGLSTDFLDGTNHAQDLGGVVRPTITSVRQRSLNAIGNANFDVAQFANLPNPIDRFSYTINGTGVISAVRTPVATALSGMTGFTGYPTTDYCYDITCTTAKPVHGATDYYIVKQRVEGPNLRPLMGGGGHSLSLVAATTIAGGCRFGLSLVDGDGTAVHASLVKLVTLPVPGTVFRISFPNLPTWPGSPAVFSTAPGGLAYTVRLCLGCGPNKFATANDVWLTSDPAVSPSGYLGAVGQDNFLATTTAGHLYIMFLQHEPGPYCSDFIDIPFHKNLAQCQRYNCKSNPYALTLPTSGYWRGMGQILYSQANYARLYVNFPVEMAITPTVAPYAQDTTINALSVEGTGVVSTTGSGWIVSTRGWSQVQFASAPAVNYGAPPVYGQWKAVTTF